MRLERPADTGLTERIFGLEGNTEIYYTGKSWKGDIGRKSTRG